MVVGSIRDLAAAARGRREELALSQAELARRAGVSRKWVSEFEAGKSTAELRLVLRVLDELGFRLQLLEAAAAGEAGSRQREALDLDILLADLEDARPKDAGGE